jgi:hypothetical protein
MRESKRLFCLMAALGLPLPLGACTGVTDLGHSDAAVASCTVQGSAVDLNSDSNNCGTCGHACASGQTCTAGNCVNETPSCPANHANCDGNLANGCEVDISVDSTNCGTCSNVCANGQVCSQGQCVNPSISCQSGFADCNANVADGCEVSTLTDKSNCGTCGTSCPGPQTCISGKCVDPVCNEGYANCDNDIQNGCETNTDRDILNCGVCTIKCSTINGTPTCSGGQCSITCSSEYGDCDGNPSNGCEIAQMTDGNNCGACGNVCGAGSTCKQGTCTQTNPVCVGTFADCDSLAANGCETNIATDSNNCGACGNKCALPNATPACTSSTCTIAACNAGYADCDGDPSNGCEVNVSTSANHCGVCTLSCNFANASSTCSGGACTLVSCNAGYGNCDANNANGCEVDLSGDVNNCGSCGNACGPNRICKQGGCTQITPVCVGTFADCDGLAANGCEMNIASSVDNCGACGNKCSLPNATPACGNSVCGIGACNNGYANCNNVSADGCEVNLQSDATHCGSCTTVCGSGSTCSQGNCIPNSTVCAVGYGNCNGIAADGCEVNLSTTVSNCGACGVACTNPNGATTCNTGVCTATCSAGYADCDNNPNNGCETNIASSTANCGACGAPCASGKQCTAGTCI